MNYNRLLSLSYYEKKFQYFFLFYNNDETYLEKHTEISRIFRKDLEEAYISE